MGFAVPRRDRALKHPLPAGKDFLTSQPIDLVELRRHAQRTKAQRVA